MEKLEYLALTPYSFPHTKAKWNMVVIISVKNTVYITAHQQSDEVYVFSQICLSLLSSNAGP